MKLVIAVICLIIRRFGKKINLLNNIFNKLMINFLNSSQQIIIIINKNNN